MRVRVSLPPLWCGANPTLSKTQLALSKVNMDQVEEIKRKTDIVEILSEKIELKRAGRNFKAVCPFHSEKTPSFMVSPELQIFKCFGCNLGGDVYSFLMEYEKIDFPQALKILADRVGIKLEPLRGSPESQDKEEIYKINNLLSELYHYILTSHDLGKRALSYLEKRGIKKEAIKVFKLGFAPDSPDFALRFLTVKKGYKPPFLEKAGIAISKDGKYFDRFRDRIIFSLRDHFANTLGFAGRIIEEKGELAKYINTPDTVVYKKGRVLYGLEVTKQDIKKSGFVVVVEGEIDAISSWQAGVKNAVAVKGSSLTEDQARLLARFCPMVFLALDADSAGIEAAKKGADIAQKVGLEAKVVVLSGFKDPDEAAQKDPALWRKAVLGAVGVYDFLIESIFKRYDPKTGEGKGKISREVTPVLASIEDEIVRAHYIKQVAGRLEVPEETVFREVSKKTPGRRVEERLSSNGLGVAKSRRALLEEYLLTLIFQTDPALLEKVESFIETPVAKRVVEEFNGWIKKEGVFDPSRFVASLPPELVDFFGSLVLADIERLVSQGEVDKEFARTKKSLEAFDAREKMGDLTRKIKELEDSGESKGMVELEAEITKMGEKLTSLEEG